MAARQETALFGRAGVEHHLNIVRGRTAIVEEGVALGRRAVGGDPAARGLFGGQEGPEAGPHRLHPRGEARVAFNAAKPRRVLLVAQSGQGVGLFVPRTHVAAEQPERATVGR